MLRMRSILKSDGRPERRTGDCQVPGGRIANVLVSFVREYSICLQETHSSFYVGMPLVL
jgi:hypothetical protein